MEGNLYIALLNPSIALVLAAAFLVLWLHQRDRRHVAVLALGYAAAAGGFLLQYFTLPIGLLPTRIVSNALFLAAASCLVGAIVARYGRPAPVGALSLASAAGLIAVSWFAFVDPDLTWRVLVVNFAIGAIVLVAVFELRAVPGKTLTDKILFGVAILAVFNFVVRTLVLVALTGPFEGYAGFHESVYWTTSMLTHAVFSVVIAVSLIVSTAVSVVAELREESQTDPLSGLLNRRGFETWGSKALEDDQRRGVPVALVLCDLDHFKMVNDTCGHAAGDRVIIAFADHLRRLAGPGCVIGRIGGEEFAVLLPTATATAARLFSEGVRASFAGASVIGVPEHIRLTASFGVAVQHGKEPLGSMINRADQALYQAKRHGRDRVKLSYWEEHQLASGREFAAGAN